MSVYFKREFARAADIFENRCGDCAFYAKVARRCRLWWALSRFNAAEVYSKRDSLSVVARDKLANSNITIGPNTTACDFFAPKKRDFPLAKAGEVCLGCGKEIEAPVAKLVRCANCGTAYKPMARKILVSYNYEQIFKDRYFQISGTQPPDRALLLPGPEQPVKSDWRDLVVLYPYETIKLGTDGMLIQREQGGRCFQAYDEIYEIVDYGVLAPEQLSEIEKKRIRVVQRSIQQGGAGQEIGLYPSARFTENLRILAEDGEFRRRFSKSLLLSVIVATKRMADRGGQPLRVLVNRQLLEYERMLKDPQITATRALAYEARVNNLYWTAYKTLLRYSGLDFNSRVRDRFVRELVESPKARARGYSPANAGINYLHQRRLVQCRIANARAGIGWIGCEGLLHIAKRKPSIGLLLDLSDSFKLADREAFLFNTLSFKISREDFIAKLGRQRLWFFFPSADGLEKLERIGLTADEMRVNSNGKDLELMAAYQESVNSFVNAVDNRNADLFRPFIYGTRNELEWLEAHPTT